MYGKRSRNMTEEKRKYYNTFDFVQNKLGNNKFNLSMFFIENALKIVEEAAKSGANCVKIQTYTADSLTINCHKLPYQQQV